MLLSFSVPIVVFHIFTNLTDTTMMQVSSFLCLKNHYFLYFIVLQLTLAKVICLTDLCFAPSLMTLMDTMVILQRSQLPDGGVLWLLVKLWMCSVG